MKSFVFYRERDTFFEGCDISKEETMMLYRTLSQAIEDDILESSIERFPDGKIEISVPFSRPEYIQILAEKLDRELTPEIGLVIGFMMNEVDEISNAIIQKLLQEGRI